MHDGSSDRGAQDGAVTDPHGGRRSRGGWRAARELAQAGVLALVVFLGMRAVVQPYEVEGASMEPTYHTGERLLVSTRLYELHRGDVVVLKPPSQQADRELIKRVIGLPGDRVTVRGGRVWVNGQQLAEPYVHGAGTACAGRWCDLTLGREEYYVLGDNRANSADSRFFGPVRRDAVRGKALFTTFPFEDFGPAPHETPTADAPPVAR